uniref:Coiled-coil domain-containing protein 39 n=1 Tax=Culicoides sonorensis TaxID=179676 RepID=A0A336LP20_CULSO
MSQIVNKNTIITDVVQLMGLTVEEGNSFIPIANEENKALVELINSMMKSKTDKTVVVNYYNGRLDKLRQSLTGVELELSQNLKLISAYKNQLSAEDHLCKLADREESRLFQQIEEIQKNQSKLDQHDKIVRTKIVELNQNMEFLSENIQMTKDMLVEWKEVIDNNQETNDLIEKYCKIDTTRAEALDSKRRITQTAIDKQRKILVSGSEEQKSLEQTLERTSQLYRQAHLERRNMVTTWKEAVTQMSQREKDIKDAENEIEKSRELTKIKEERLKQVTQKYEIQMLDNKELELHMEDLNSGHSTLKQNFTSLQETLQTNESELNSLRNEVQNIANKLANQRALNKKLVQEETDKEAACRKSVGELEALKKKHENFKSKKMNAQERLKQLDDFVEAEEKQIKSIEDEMSRLKGALFRAEQQLHKLQEQEKLMDTEAHAIKSSIGRVKVNNKNDIKELSRQWDIAYHLEYNIQQAEIRIDNMKGSKSPDEDLKLDDQIRSLEMTLQAKKQSLNQISSQTTKMEDDLRKMTFEFNNGSNEMEKLSGKLKEKKLTVEGGEKMFKSTTVETQEHLVELSLMRMRVKQMERALAKQDDKAYTLEKHKMELEAAISERLLDIKAQTEMLMLNRKYLVEERSQLKADIAERNMKIDALKKRYECAMDLLGKNEDGSLVTATQIKIENAQEKYILLKEGNDLNEKVLKAESDIKVMENTLRLMNLSNDQYKKSFEKVEDNSAELKNLNDLQNEYCKLLNQLKNLRTSLTNKMHKLDETTTKKEQIEKDLDEAERNRLDSNDTLLKIQKEFIDQREKLERAERELKLAIKAVRRKYVDSDFIRLFERDLNTRELEERDNSALQQLADCVEAYTEMGPSVTRYLYEKGLKMPSRAPVWRSVESMSEYSLRVDRVCSRISQRSFMSSTSSQPSTTSNITKGTTRTSAGMSVVNLDFMSNDGNLCQRSIRAGKSQKDKSKSSKF